MEKKIKTEKVSSIYNLLSNAKYGKLDDRDKIRVWKITRLMKPYATKYDEDSKDAAEKLKPQDYKSFDADLAKAQEYEVKNGIGCAMTKDEYNDFVVVFKNYNYIVKEAIKKFAETEVTLDFDGLTEDAFGKLMASNDWTFEQAMEIGFLIVE